MLLGLLVCGILAGALAAVVSLIAGYSLWAAFGFYVLGGIVGICGSGLVLWARRSRRRRRAATSSAGSPRSATPKSASPGG